MTLYLFRQLSPPVRVLYALERGTYLASCWEAEDGVNLYHLPSEQGGHSVELDIREERAVVLRSFTSSVPLEDYAHRARLPAL